MKSKPIDFDLHNREILREFLRNEEKTNDFMSGNVLATIAQFIVNLRITIEKTSCDWVTFEELIDAQVQELRRCIIDLEAYKQRLLQGVTHQ